MERMVWKTGTLDRSKWSQDDEGGGELVLFSLAKERRGRLKWRESGRGCATRPTEGKDGSTIHPQWLQSQEQKLLRARSVAVIRMLMRIDRGHLATRGQTREFRGVARAESFLRHGVCTRRARVSAPR